MNGTLRKFTNCWDIVRDICFRLFEDDKKDINGSNNRIKRSSFWENRGS